MTAVQPGLSVRDSQILELLRSGAPVQRVVDIGRHRKSWNATHVGAVVACQFGTRRALVAEPAPAPAPAPSKKPRSPAECGTPAGYAKHKRNKEEPCEPCRQAINEYQQQYRAEMRPRPAHVPWTPGVEPRPDAPDVPLGGAVVSVLALLCDGLPNRVIGKRLHIAEDTVKSHIKRLLVGVGARDRTHIVALVLSGQVRILVPADWAPRDTEATSSA